jgi:hypothetical protein
MACRDLLRVGHLKGRILLARRDALGAQYIDGFRLIEMILLLAGRRVGAVVMRVCILSFR